LIEGSGSLRKFAEVSGSDFLVLRAFFRKIAEVSGRIRKSPEVLSSLKFRRVSVEAESPRRIALERLRDALLVTPPGK
jgi:hypothetical protein